MISIDTADLYVIYSKSSSGMELCNNEVYVTESDAEQKAEECREIAKQIEDKIYTDNSNLRSKFYVATLADFLYEYADYTRWEGENARE